MIKGLLLFVFLFVPVAYSKSSEIESCPQSPERTYLRTIIKGVSDYDNLWVDNKEDLDTGYIDFTQYRSWLNGYVSAVFIPGNGMLSLAYAVLYKYSDENATVLSKEELLNRAEKILRYISLTSSYNEGKIEFPFENKGSAHPEIFCGNQWCRPSGSRVDMIGYAALAAGLLWSELKSDTKYYLEIMFLGVGVKGSSDYYWKRGSKQGGNHDQVKQDLMSTLGAAYLVPQHKNNTFFKKNIESAGVNLVSTPSRFKRIASNNIDTNTHTKVSGGWNLFPDFSSDHHGRAQIFYGIQSIFEARLAVSAMAKLTNSKTPETYNEFENHFDGVLKWALSIAIDNGALLHPHGAEYDSYTGAAPSLAFAYGSVFRNDNRSAELEKCAANMLYLHQSMNKEYDYHTSSLGVASLAFLTHRLNRKKNKTQKIRTLASEKKKFHYKYQRNIIHRENNKLASFSWGSITSGKGFSGHVIPQDEKMEGPMIYSHENSLTGKVIGADINNFYHEAKVFIKSIVGDSIVNYVKELIKRPTTSLNKTDVQYLDLDYLDDIINKKGNINYQVKDTENGFGTIGSVTRPGYYKQSQFFYSFDNGPVINFINIMALDDIKIDGWSGMPIYIYNRNGLADNLNFYYKNGNKKLKELDDQTVQSSWYSIENMLGLVSIYDKNIDLLEDIGFNWARKKTYRDRLIKIAIGAKGSQNIEKEEHFVVNGAVIYPNLPYSLVSKKANQTIDLTKGDFRGWVGVILPSMGETFLIAMANIGDKEKKVKIDYAVDSGLPVFSFSTNIINKRGRFETTLKPLGIVTEKTHFSVVPTNDFVGTVKLENKNSIKVSLLSGSVEGVIIRYLGDVASYKVTIVNHDRQEEQTYKTISQVHLINEGIKLEAWMKNVSILVSQL